MKSKTIAALMLCAAWMLCLWGCESAEPTQTTQADAPQVGMCFRKQADSEIPQYPQLLTQALTDAGYTVRTAAAGNDQSKQNTQFKKFLDEKVDLLVVEPVMVGTAGDLIRQAQAADIPLVFVNREPEDQDLKLWEKTCYVGCNRELASLLQGSIVLNTPDQGDINGDGTVCYGVIGGPVYDLDAQARTARCTELLTEAGVQVELLACQNGDWSDENGRQSCASLLSTYGKDL